MVVFLNLLCFLVEEFFNCMVFYKSIRQAQIGKECKRKACERYLMPDNTSGYESLLKKATLPTLYSRRLQHLAILMFKVKNGMSPDYISELFQRSDTNCNLRNSDFMIPRSNTITFGKYSIKYLGPYQWRKLPIALRTLTETDKFKRKISESDLAGHLTEDKCWSECCRNVPYAAYRTQTSSRYPEEAWNRVE